MDKEEGRTLALVPATEATGTMVLKAAVDAAIGTENSGSEMRCGERVEGLWEIGRETGVHSFM